MPQCLFRMRERESYLAPSPACAEGWGEGAQAQRTQSFAEEFNERSSLRSLCVLCASAVRE